MPIIYKRLIKIKHEDGSHHYELVPKEEITDLWEGPAQKTFLTKVNHFLARIINWIFP